MCRLLLVKSKDPFKIQDYLDSFSRVARNSQEYQGHGWGCAYLENGGWQLYKNILPIWEDDLSRFGKTRLLLAHARSAFQDQGIAVENNMPFKNGNTVFIFNGELRGVKISEQGRIGAEKIFNYILRFNHGNLFAACKRALPIIEKRTDYIRAMNIIMADRNRIYLSSLFNEQADYFSLYFRNEQKRLVICSQPFAGQNDWHKIANRELREINDVAY